MKVKFSGKFADVQRDADRWVQDHPGIYDKSSWTIIVEYEDSSGDFAYRCPVTGRDTRGVAASPEQTGIRVVGPCCYATIQAAIDDSKDGDTVIITPDAYGQTSNECYAIVVCTACTKLHLVERTSGRADPVVQHSRVQVVGRRK